MTRLRLLTPLRLLTRLRHHHGSRAVWLLFAALAAACGAAPPPPTAAAQPPVLRPVETKRVVEAAAPVAPMDTSELLVLAREEELRGELGRAYGLLVEVVDQRRALHGPADRSLLSVLADLARLGHARGNQVAAGQWLRESRELLSDLEGEAYLAQLRDLLALGRLHRTAGDPARAAALCSEVLPGLERELGQDAPLVVDVRVELADLLLELGRDSEAEPHLQIALDVAEAHGGKHHVDTLQPRRALAELASRAGDWAAAHEQWRVVLVTELELFGKSYGGLGDSRFELARSTAQLGTFAEAETVYQAALADYRANGGGGAPDYRRITILREVGRLRREQQKLPEAQAVLETALSESRAALGPAHAETLRCIDELVLVLVDEKQLKQARELAVEALLATPAKDPERGSRKERAAALGVEPAKAAGGKGSEPGSKPGAARKPQAPRSAAKAKGGAGAA